MAYRVRDAGFRRAGVSSPANSQNDSHHGAVSNTCRSAHSCLTCGAKDMRTETDLCPIELSWATFQRKVPSGKNNGIVHNIPLRSLRLNLLVPQPARDPMIVYICDVTITAVFKRPRGVTGDQKVRVALHTTNFPISEPFPLEFDVALSSNLEIVGHTIEVSHAKVPVPSTVGSHEFISEVEFIAGETVLGKATVLVHAVVNDPQNAATIER